MTPSLSRSGDSGGPVQRRVEGVGWGGVGRGAMIK